MNLTNIDFLLTMNLTNINFLLKHMRKSMSNQDEMKMEREGHRAEAL